MQSSHVQELRKLTCAQARLDTCQATETSTHCEPRGAQLHESIAVALGRLTGW